MSFQADECFFTSTSIEVMAMVQLDGKQIGANIPGPITKHLQAAFEASISE